MDLVSSPAAYNNDVLTRQAESASKHARHRAYGQETTGLLVIAFLLLVLTLIRYWRYIPWNVR